MEVEIQCRIRMLSVHWGLYITTVTLDQESISAVNEGRYQIDVVRQVYHV